jgi:hypothetical protein
LKFVVKVNVARDVNTPYTASHQYPLPHTPIRKRKSGKREREREREIKKTENER